MPLTYVLIGAGLAGAHAAQAIRERDAEGRIIVVGAEAEPPYNRPDLSQGYLLGTRPVEEVYWRPEGFYQDQRIELILDDCAEQLDADRRTVTLEGGRMLQYDRLLLAMGGRACNLEQVPGSNLANIYTLRTLADATALRNAAPGAQRAVVVGGGFIAAEAGAALTRLGLRVTLVFPEDTLLQRALGDLAGRWLGDYFTARGVTLVPRAQVAAFVGADQALRAVALGSGREVPADLAVLGVGITLNTRLAEQAGLELDRGLGGGVVVDAYLRTARPEIYAAGDIAAFDSTVYQRRMRLEHWDHACRSGQTAGHNMAGAEESYAELPRFCLNAFDLNVEAYGDLCQWDEVLPRVPLEPGDGQPALVLFYLQRSVLKGALVINPPERYLEPVQLLLKMKPMLTAADRERLADPGAPIA